MITSVIQMVELQNCAFLKIPTIKLESRENIFLMTSLTEILKTNFISKYSYLNGA